MRSPTFGYESREADQPTVAPERMTPAVTEKADRTSQGTYVSSGRGFERDTAYISPRVTVDGRDGYTVDPARYRLIVARACPWANRSIIVRRLLGLEDAISMGICGPVHDERSWTF